MRVNYAELPEQFKKTSNAWGVLVVLRIWAAIAVAVAFAVGVPGVGSWLTAVCVIGVMQYHLSVLGHHTLHRNITTSRGLNDLLARFLVHGPLGLPQDAMWRNHMLHHSRFETDEDPEREHYQLEVHGRTTRAGLVLWWVTRFVGAEAVFAARRVVRGSVGTEAGKSDLAPVATRLRDWFAVACAQAGIAGGLWLASGHWWAYLALWTLPQVTVLTGLMGSRTMLEHADNGEPPRRLMSFGSGLLGRLLLGPMGFNRHAEHHLYPTIPAQHLPALHTWLVERGALEDVVLLRSYSGRFIQLFRSLP